MPELRQNLATKEWVIIATERAKRPNAYAEQPSHPLTLNRPTFDAGCPFCPGNEELDLEIERLPHEGAWQTRVVRNKYPALTADNLLTRTFDGVERRVSAVGYHEVLIEHPHHNTCLALMTTDEVRMVMETYQQRGQIMSADLRIEQVIYFQNHGERAGASLPHAHSQIMALPMVPVEIRRRTEEAQRYFDDHGECVICAMIEDELARGDRIITVNNDFIVFSLYAALSPFHTWIVPRRHRANFLHADAQEIASLGAILRDLLRRMYFGLNDPDYNFIVRSTPTKELENGYFHWYVTLVPRLSRTAGFELGSGMRINPSLPEACAEFLRSVLV